MQVVMLSISWENIHKDPADFGNEDQPAWAVKLCGLRGDERTEFASVLDEKQDVFLRGNDMMLIWNIKRLQYQRFPGHTVERFFSKALDPHFPVIFNEENYVQDNKKDYPLEFIVKYTNKLLSLNYTLTTAPTSVTCDQNLVWTFTKETE